MATVPPFKPSPLEEPPVKKSGCTPMSMLLIGCIGVMLVCVLLCAGIGIFGYRWGIKQVNDFAQEYEKQGYQRQAGQAIEVRESPKTDTVYVCQVLKIEGDVDVDLAIMSQVVEVNADIHGDVEFLGQMMKVAKGATIDGDLYVKTAQLVEIEGEVKGKITGSYQELKYGGKTYSSGKSPTSEAEDAEKSKEARQTKNAEAEAVPPATPTAPEAPESPVPPTASNL
jgi:cytoskeletal protein CcmA (bactofilin family)